MEKQHLINNTYEVSDNDIIVFQGSEDDCNAYISYKNIISKLNEISDDEIEKGAEENTCYMNDFILGAKWYREQLKKKQ